MPGYSNAIYEDIPSRPGSVHQGDRSSYLSPADTEAIIQPSRTGKGRKGIRGGKNITLEAENPAFEEDYESSEEELEGAVGGLPVENPYPVHPPPYSEKDAQMARIMAYSKTENYSKGKGGSEEDNYTEYRQKGGDPESPIYQDPPSPYRDPPYQNAAPQDPFQDPPPYSTRAEALQVTVEQGKVPDKEPIDVLY